MSGRILVVDDNPANVDLLEAHLVGAGYEVIPAYSGAEALSKVQTDPPDLILLDIMMPGINGFEVCRTLKEGEETRFIPVVMVTVLTEVEDRVRALEVGADDFLSKPVDKNELLARVRSLIRVKRLHDQLEQAKRRVEQQNAELIRLQRMRDELVHMMVHDLKNPLSGVFSRLQMLDHYESANMTEWQRRNIRKALQSGQMLLNMITTILDVHRMEEGKLALHLEPVSLRELVDQSISEVVGEAEEANVDVPSDIPTVEIDRSLIRRVLDNLLINAKKYTPRNGEFGVRVRKGEGDTVVVSVWDTGEGIPKEFHEKIFEKFGQVETQAAGQRIGSGLGLTFCKMAVERHGGTIWVESEVGKGSTFSFTLPVKPPASSRNMKDLGIIAQVQSS